MDGKPLEILLVVCTPRINQCRAPSPGHLEGSKNNFSCGRKDNFGSGVETGKAHSTQVGYSESSLEITGILHLLDKKGTAGFGKAHHLLCKYMLFLYTHVIFVFFTLVYFHININET